MIKDYEKAEPKLDEEDKLDLLNTNIILENPADQDGNINTVIETVSLFTTGFINTDLVELQDNTVKNLVLMPFESYTGGEVVGYDVNTQREKAITLKSYTNIDVEFLAKMPKFSIKENFTLERNGVEIMQNVIRRVTEVQALDAERIPLLGSVIEQVVAVINTLNGQGGASGLAIVVEPTPVTQAWSDFEEKDSEFREKLEELATETKAFINKAEGEE